MKLLHIFGTRPEAIKMAPVVRATEEAAGLESKVCITAQHREMLDQVLDFFEIRPDYDLNLMRPNQSLHELSARILTELQPVLDDYRPDFVLVHGDTSTTLMASLAAFYRKIPVAHVEAGLRTYDKYAPFPEEINRQLTGRLADVHFAPTPRAKANLETEKTPGDILVTGNTVIDSLLWSIKKLENYSDEEIEDLRRRLDFNKKIVLITGHRRENFGEGFQRITRAIRRLAETHPDVEWVYPVHLNPNVQDPVYSVLDGLSNVHLIAPLRYPAFVWLMDKSFMIITDSGGIQEEAPALGKPVLVMRETTERPEAVEAGTVKLVGTDPEKIISYTEELLSEGPLYRQMKRAHNPYGDGKAAERIKNYFLNLNNTP
ncbi:MAG: UDP-N-acetylglucosamine 2-epimerase (non-hydrolyzing) [Chlorobi bacterium]|nr:UDP-N-acetylglucosamine 2-epimerase (non-hydrolyzing) [Chlorobiota bacterium]